MSHVLTQGGGKVSGGSYIVVEVNAKLVWLLKELYRGAECAARVQNKLSDWFLVMMGINRAAFYLKLSS